MNDSITKISLTEADGDGAGASGAGACADVADVRTAQPHDGDRAVAVVRTVSGDRMMAGDRGATPGPYDADGTASVSPAATAALARAMRPRLAAWWEVNARDLPWRFGRSTPWGVLVSEVMSQQTQMGRVVPYWESWMRAWPGPAELAAAPTAEVITAWGRLGYPRRALRLQECARAVVDRFGGHVPDDYDDLMALPGIGDYTASAVLSFAYGRRIAVIDTNIRRVLSRALLGEESRGGAASRAERELAWLALPEDGAADGSLDDADDIDVGAARGTMIGAGTGADDAHTLGEGSADISRVCRNGRETAAASVVWNQAVMELGAVTCTAKAPLCDSCPVSGQCRWLAAGRPGMGERRTRPRQSFKGTNRQVRGIILDALRKAGMATGLDAETKTVSGAVGDGGQETRPRPDHPGLTRAELAALWPDRAQLDLCVATLDDDGLIEIDADGRIRLPR